MVLGVCENWLCLCFLIHNLLIYNHKDLRNKPMERKSIHKYNYFFDIFIEELKFHEVESLLKEIYISKVFNVEDELCYTSKRH